MAWWSREGPQEEASDEAPDEGSRPPEWTGSRLPGLSEMLEGASGRSVLDLGPAVPSHLDLYSELARRVRFADVDRVWARLGWNASIREEPKQPYDLVLGWDLLDRIPSESRGPMVERLAQVTAPKAQLHMVVRGTREAEPRTLHFELTARDRIRYRPTGPPRPPRTPILPAEMERILDPFRVLRGFTLKGGLREYVARRKD